METETTFFVEIDHHGYIDKTLADRKTENVLREEILKLKQQQQINNDYTMALFYVCVILFFMISLNFVFLLGEF